MLKSWSVLRGGVLVGVFAILAGGCGGFGEEEGKGTDQPARTPEENAVPPPTGPVNGEPIKGIYVSASQGKPGASGVPGSPVPTIKEGLAIAKREGLPVLVCAEEYKENIELLDGVSAYGDFDCSSTLWARGAKRAVVRAPVSPAVVGRNITSSTRIEGFEILAPDLDAAVAKDREGTSVALDVRASKALIVSKSLLRGGKGAPGTDGAAGPANEVAGERAGKPGEPLAAWDCLGTFGFTICQSRTFYSGPLGPSVTCTVGAAPGPGGRGGSGAVYSDGLKQGEPNVQGQPAVATAQTAQGGTAGVVGTNGSPGPIGTDGANGSWRFDGEGFVIGDGAAGGEGGPGQGGGGGSGTSVPTCSPVACPYAGYWHSSTGGSGAAGGCGGLAGTPGTGGGASIGALLINAEVTFTSATIESSQGGAAGKGSFGGPGRAGGLGGAAGGGSGTTKGGDGGAGGAGGVSGHGAPGPSIAVVFTGKRPVYDAETKRVPGPAGTGHPEAGLATPTGTKVLPAISGVAKDEHEFTP